MTGWPSAITFSVRAAEVIKMIEMELSKEVKDRSAQIFDDNYLRNWLKTIHKMKEDFETKNLPPKTMRDRGLRRIIIDCWPFNTKLGNAISELEDYYINL